MEILKKIKHSIARYYLKNKLTKNTRERRLISLKDAKDIGILYLLTNNQDYMAISKFVKLLQDQNKRVKALGFVKQKHLTNRFLPKLSFDFFSKKDLNWYGKPSNVFIKDFIEKDFDIIIDMSLQDNYPLQYISGMSKAKLKVGRFGENNSDIYDVMIQNEKNSNLDKYINEVHHYLSILKPKNNV
ncbi:MAG: hypothetical protein KAV70_07330 [Bacteroidales bacterium]|nr:hypothetical protein [Bacteroidales bacterium]